MLLKFSKISWLGLTLGLVLNHQVHALCTINCTKNKCNQSEQVTNSCVDKCKFCQDIKKGRDELKMSMKTFNEKKEVFDKAHKAFDPSKHENLSDDLKKAQDNFAYHDEKTEDLKREHAPLEYEYYDNAKLTKEQAEKDLDDHKRPLEKAQAEYKDANKKLDALKRTYPDIKM